MEQLRPAITGRSYVDVDGDNYAAPIDALTIINWINAGHFTAPASPRAPIRPQPTKVRPTVTGWAASMSSGTLTGSGYTQTFHVSADHPEYFKVQPAIDANGAYLHPKT